MIFRIRFSKYGAVRFIGHLDVMRYFQKAVRRSGLQIRYSQGFNPHQLMVFAQPLGVGISSDGEYMDIEVEDTAPECESTFKYVTDAKTGNGERMEYVLSKALINGDTKKVEADMQLAADRVKETLEKGLTEGFEIISCRVIPWSEGERHPENAMSLVNGADYLLSLKNGYSLGMDKAGLQKCWDAFMAQESIRVVKKTKSGETETDIRPAIYRGETVFDDTLFKNEAKGLANAQRYESGICFYLRLSAGSSLNIKPELVMEAFCGFAGIEFDKPAFQIHRMNMFRNVENALEL